MQVFCAYKADPESAEVKPGSFELAEVRVPVIAQEYKVELAVDSRDGWGCVSVRWGGDTTYYTEACVDADGDTVERVRRVDLGDELAFVGLCIWTKDEEPEGGAGIDDYLAWLDGNVELIEVDGRPFYVNPGKGAR